MVRNGIMLLNVLGLCLTLYGAWVAARGQILTREQATQMAGGAIGFNEKMRDELLKQSDNAVLGLKLVALGTLLQLPAAFRR